MSYDLAVIGLGAMGSAAVATAARRGLRAIGLEQFHRGHELGASAGRSRMIRKAYFEDPAYVPIVLRAYQLWAELERRTGETFLRQTGVLAVGEEGSEIISGTQRAARMHGLLLESLDAAAIAARFPSVRLAAGEVGVFEPDAGVLASERAVAAQLHLAEEAGAELRFETGAAD